MKFMKFWCNFFDVEQSNKKGRQAAFLACSLALAVREPERAPALFLGEFCRSKIFYKKYLQRFLNICIIFISNYFRIRGVFLLFFDS